MCVLNMCAGVWGSKGVGLKPAEIDMHTCIHTHARTRMHTHAHTCTHKHTQAHPRTHICTHTHTHAHTHMRAHTHTHTPFSGQAPRSPAGSWTTPLTAASASPWRRFAVSGVQTHEATRASQFTSTPIANCTLFTGLSSARGCQQHCTHPQLVLTLLLSDVGLLQLELHTCQLLCPSLIRGQGSTVTDQSPGQDCTSTSTTHEG